MTLLSICIPTYNQPYEVNRLLSSIDRVEVSKYNIEIIIQDDSLNNKTKEIVDHHSDLGIKYFGRFRKIGEKLNKGEKGGLDESLIFLTRKAKGRCIWWVGDDEIAPGAISTICDILSKDRDITFIWASHNSNYNEHQPNINSFYYKNGIDAVLNLGKNLGYISSTIIDRKIALASIDLSRRYVGTAFVNLHIVLYVILNGSKSYHISKTCIINHPNCHKDMNDDGFQVFGANLYNVFYSYVDIIGNNVFKSIMRNNFTTLWKGMYVRWVIGYESPRKHILPLIKYYWYDWRISLAVILFMLPLTLNKAFYFVYKKLKF